MSTNGRILDSNAALRAIIDEAVSDFLDFLIFALVFSDGSGNSVEARLESL